MPSVWAAILAFRVKHESGTAFIASLPIPAGRRFFLSEKGAAFSGKGGRSLLQRTRFACTFAG